MQIALVSIVIISLVALYGWGLYHTIKADRCYIRIRIATQALENANNSEHAKIKVYRLIDRAQKASYNRSTEAIIRKLVEKYNQKFNSSKRHAYEEAYELY